MKHLSEVREKEISNKKKEDLSTIIGFYVICLMFDKERMMNLIKQEVTSEVIGKEKLDEERKEILKLNPLFAIMKYLNEKQMERDVELGLLNLRNRKEREKDKQ